MTAYVIMGVSGCGKSTVGQGVARVCGFDFIDGDNLHPQASIDKMARGEPLNDADRAPWLRAVGDSLSDGRIVACSALKRAYRDLIREHARTPVTFLYLRGRRQSLIERMSHRTGHFMPAKLLDSQIATLEEPGPDEGVIVADIEQSPEDIIRSLAEAIAQKNPAAR